MIKSFNKAVEVCRELTRWQVSPYACLYKNPKKYTLVEFARWSQRYLNCKIYEMLLNSAKITGYEPVPAELLNRHAARDGYTERKVRVGKAIFYLIKPEEMSVSLKTRYEEFKNVALSNNSGAVK